MDENSVISLKSEDSKEGKFRAETSRKLSVKSVEIANLFGFSPRTSTADENLGEKELVDKGLSFARKKIFINHVDQFNGKYIAKFLCEQEFEETDVPEVMSLEVVQDVDDDDEEDKDDDLEDDVDDVDVKESLEELEAEAEDEEIKTEITPTEIEKVTYFEIIGTVKDKDYKVPEDVSEVVQYLEDDEEFMSKILSCGFVIYDITRDPQQVIEATKVLEDIDFYLNATYQADPKAFKGLKEIRRFILISSMMTWAMTKLTGPENPDNIITEDDYRKRKPHPDYKEHIKLERLVTKIGGGKYKDKFRTLVITTGIPYGAEEDSLHFLFRMAWENNPELPVFHPGNNLVPLIHIKDLAQILLIILNDFPHGEKFIFTMEDPVITLHEIVKSIADAMGNGRVTIKTREEVLSHKGITPDSDIYDLLNINLYVEPVYIFDKIEVPWKYDSHFSYNIANIVKEYKDARKLKPLIIFIHGPPGVGKTKLSKRLCNHYKLHYIDVDAVVQETINQMRDLVQKRAIKEKQRRQRDYEEDEDEEDIERFLEDTEGVVEMLQDVETNLEKNQGKLDDEYKIKFVKERMVSKYCQNQGYVLDGYPVTVEEAIALFDAESEEEESMAVEEEDEFPEDLPMYNKATTPEFIISLEASDDYLTKKFLENVMQSGEKETEVEFLSRLEEFRKLNNDLSSVLDYFDEIEIHPEVFNIVEDPDPYLENTFQKIVKMIGKPRNYGPSPEELLKIAKEEEIVKKIEEEVQKQKKQDEERKAYEEHLEKLESYAILFNAAKRREEELLARKALPARHYLMKYVIPVLTEGLLEVAKVKPDDPVDYLAEYLLMYTPKERLFEVTDIDSDDEHSGPSSRLSLLSIDSVTSSLHKFIQVIVHELTDIRSKPKPRNA